MKIIGKKVITLSEAENNILRGAAHILDILGDEIDSTNCDDDLVIEINRAYDLCMEITRRKSFEYDIDDGNE
jgi:hypothetical protein